MDNSSNQPSNIIIIFKLNVVPTFFHLVFINMCICGYHVDIVETLVETTIHMYVN